MCSTHSRTHLFTHAHSHSSLLILSHKSSHPCLFPLLSPHLTSPHPPPPSHLTSNYRTLPYPTLGVEIDITSAKSLQLSLKAMNKNSDPIVSQAISALLLHPMNLAKYLVVADMGPPAWRHYALSIPYYTHFTSPIRRYADVMVHRLLDLSIRDPNGAATEGMVQQPSTFLSSIYHLSSQPLHIVMLSFSYSHEHITTYTISHILSHIRLLIYVFPRTYLVVYTLMIPFLYTHLH